MTTIYPKQQRDNYHQLLQHPYECTIYGVLLILILGTGDVEASFKLNYLSPSSSFLSSKSLSSPVSLASSSPSRSSVPSFSSNSSPSLLPPSASSSVPSSSSLHFISPSTSSSSPTKNLPFALPSSSFVQEVKKKASSSSSLRRSASPGEGVDKTQARPNVVKENPSLDVGPLMEARVTEGDAARLPCIHQPSNADDAARLVLWYRNDTSRPFLSYDSRSNSVTSSEKDGGRVGGGGSFPTLFASGFLSEGKTRIFLADGGSSLVIKGVQISDQAEYRCKVHYSHSPSVTRRIKLVVTGAANFLQLLDSSGRPVGDHVGPFSEGSHLSLTCRAKFGGELVSLEWLVDGKQVASSWTRKEDDLILSNLELPLTRSHAHATLTCRLNSSHPPKAGITASITDASTTILMYYVPQATLIVDSAATDGFQTADEAKGVTLQVTEGVTVTFICAVKARPAPYNISWLHNGRIIGSGSRRWAKHNSSMVVSPVTKEDTGLYTCLASNTEGDGQSNAVNLRVAHAPYCKGPTQQQVVVTRNSTVVLACEVEAEPQAVTFSWTFDPAKNYARPTSAYSSNMQIYAPNYDSKEKKLRNIHKLISPTYRNDPVNPRRSLLTITPENNVQGVVCYAKNQVGRMQVPCAFTLKFVDPPQAPEDCSVTVLGSSEIRVRCASRHQTLHLQDGVPRMTPGLSFVLSPEAKTSSHLEVWSKGSLISNLTGDKPQWLLQDLPPDTDLMLRLYSTSPHSQSDPVVLYTRTRPRYLTSIQATPNVSHPTPGKPPLTQNPGIELPAKGAPSPPSTPPGGSIGVWGLISGLVGGVGAMLVLLILSIFFLKRRGRRRRPPIVARMTTPSSEEEPAPIAGVSVSSLKSEISDDSEVHLETSA